LKLRHYSSNREWCCRIVGKDEKYRFARQFLHPYQRDWSGSGRTGDTYYDITQSGVYEFKNPFDDVYFIRIEGNYWETLNEGEVEEYLEKGGVNNGN
jgi:hypothetical protein